VPFDDPFHDGRLHIAPDKHLDFISHLRAKQGLRNRRFMIHDPLPTGLCRSAAGCVREARWRRTIAWMIPLLGRSALQLIDNQFAMLLE